MHLLLYFSSPQLRDTKYIFSPTPTPPQKIIWRGIGTMMWYAEGMLYVGKKFEEEGKNFE